MIKFYFSVVDIHNMAHKINWKLREQLIHNYSLIIIYGLKGFGYCNYHGKG